MAGQVYIDVRDIPELNVVEDNDEVFTVGASVRLNQLLDACAERRDSNPLFGTIWDHVIRVAGQHVRDQGAWIGGVMMQKQFGFPSDLATVMLSANARVKVAANDGTETVMSFEDFLNSDADGECGLLKVLFSRIANRTYPPRLATN